MKKYILFAYDHYYPCGGMNDFAGSFDTIESAHRIGSEFNDYHIVDRDTWEKVK